VPGPQHQHDSAHQHRRHAVYAAETRRWLRIAFLLFALPLVRYRHAIAWSGL
jgi:hypothetical protein